jgi:uncharacterized protein YbgA (DUF1722 family)/uncharacterized protein YbbK (DUF523 family)
VDRSPIRIGVSQCLLGENVRFDGGHKRDPFITDFLGRFVEYVPVCPEAEVGMGIPREPIRLVRREDDVRLVTVKTGIDHTDAMRTYAEKKASALAKLDLSGYVLKKDSPSCGLERVKVYDAHLSPTKTGRGTFATVLCERLPFLPIEEEGRLNDPRLRENFVERVFAYRRITDFFAGRWTMGGLVALHAREKLLLLAHEPAGYTALGRLVAGAKRRPRDEVAREYRERHATALSKLATNRRHVNVLQHAAGYFKKLLPPEDRRELEDVIQQYGKGLLPLIVPITLLKHHVRKNGIEYLAGQVYLEPHPRELALRNHA